MDHDKENVTRKLAWVRFPGTSPILLLCLVAYAALLAVAVSAEAPIHVTFQADQLGLFPSGWVSRDGNPGRIYTVQTEGGKRFLRADARDASVQIGYERKWAVKEWPLLRWQWRAVVFPEHSDERVKRGGDSALGVYVVFGHWPFLRSIKYIWSDTRPVGESFDSPASSRTKMMVIRSGRGQAGTWVTEERDVLSDYRRLFGSEDEAPHARGIALLTDSDNTHSHAVGDYTEIEVLEAAADGGRIRP